MAAGGSATDVAAPERRLAIKAFIAAFAPLFALALLHLGMPVLATSLMEAAGRPAVDFGWISGATGLGAVWLYTANTAFTTALGPVRACQVSAGLSIVGVGLVITANFQLMLLGALLIGFGYAAVTPAGSQILADHTPREARSTLFSIRQAAVPLGGAVAGVAGSWIAVRWGWRSALVIMGVASLLLVPVLALAPRALNESRPRPRFSLAALVRPANLVDTLRLVRGLPGLMRMAIACIGFATVQGTFNAFFVVYLTSALGFSLTVAGGLFAIIQAVSFLGRMGLGFVADRIGSPRPVLRCLAAMSALSSVLMIFISAGWPAWQLYAALVFMGLSIATWNGLYLAEIATMAPDNVGDTTAAVTVFVFGTYMIVPPIMSVVIKHLGFAPAFMIAGAFAATAIVAVRGQPGRARSAPR